SLPNHLYTVAAQSAGAISNADSPRWGCDATPQTFVEVAGPGGQVSRQYPCFDIPTVADRLESSGVSWRYYAPSQHQHGYIWSALDAINHIRKGPVLTTLVLT